MYVVTNADKTVYIGQDFTDQRCDVKANGTDLYYVTDPGTGWSVRDSANPVQTSTTGIATVSGTKDAYDYTVADSSVFRVGEVLGLYASDGTTRRGSVRVESLPDGTTVRVRIHAGAGTFTPASGDKLQYLPDQLLPDGDSIEVVTRRTTTMLVKSAIANTSLNNMLVTPLSSTVQKKN